MLIFFNSCVSLTVVHVGGDLVIYFNNLSGNLD